MDEHTNDPECHSDTVSNILCLIDKTFYRYGKTTERKNFFI